MCRQRGQIGPKAQPVWLSPGRFVTPVLYPVAKWTCYGCSMCGRYLITSHSEAIRQFFKVDQLPNIGASHNVEPTQKVPIVRLKGRRPQTLHRALGPGAILGQGPEDRAIA